MESQNTFLRSITHKLVDSQLVERFLILRFGQWMGGSNMAA